MPGICRECGEPITNGFHCGCGVNTNAVEAFISKGGRSRENSTCDPVDGLDGLPPSVEDKAIDPEFESPTTPSDTQDYQAGLGIASLELQLAKLKVQINQIEGEIAALFKQRKSTSSLEWYRFAIDQNAGLNDPDAVGGLGGVSAHIFSWAFLGFVWIPVGFALWLTRHAERVGWDLALIREVNRKVNDQIKAHRGKRTGLLAQVGDLEARLKELAAHDGGTAPGRMIASEARLDGAVTDVGVKAHGVLAGIARLPRKLLESVPVGICPNCKANWSDEPDGENPLSTEFFPGFATTSQTNKAGQVTVSQVVVVRQVTHYDERHKCRKCSHRWAVRKKRETRLTDVCPECHRPQSKEWIRTEQVGSRDHLGSETVVDAVHLDSGNRHIGSTLRRASVALRTVNFERFFRCKACGHEWAMTSSETSRL